MNIADHFCLLLKPLFPGNANLKIIDLKTDELVFRIDWRVPAPGRPNRRSRPILLKTTSDGLDDYKSDPKGQQLMDLFIAQYVKAQLGTFADDYVAAPAFEWGITPDNTYAKPLMSRGS